MKHPSVQVLNLTRPAMPRLQAKWCQSFLSRLQGFTFRKELRKDEGLILVEARDSRMDTAIHMFFVFTDLAIAWVNSENVVVDTALAKAWRPFYASARPARYVIEYHPARLGDFQKGDQVKFNHG